MGGSDGTRGAASPAGGAGRRELHFVFAVDTSGSMAGERIASLNFAVRAAMPALRDAAADNPEVDVLVRVLRFADAVTWVTPEPVAVDAFAWTDLDAAGETNMGAALDALATAMSAEAMPGRQLPAVVVLMSDGLPTDDVSGPLDAFLSAEHGAAAIRIAIAIGSEADLDLLQAFIGRPAIRPLQANNAAALVDRIRWAASVPVRNASQPVGSGGAMQDIARGVAEENADAGDLVW